MGEIIVNYFFDKAVTLDILLSALKKIRTTKNIDESFECKFVSSSSNQFHYEINHNVPVLLRFLCGNNFWIFQDKVKWDLDSKTKPYIKCHMYPQKKKTLTMEVFTTFVQMKSLKMDKVDANYSPCQIVAQTKIRLISPIPIPKIVKPALVSWGEQRIHSIRKLEEQLIDQIAATKL